MQQQIQLSIIYDIGYWEAIPPRWLLQQVSMPQVLLCEGSMVGMSSPLTPGAAGCISLQSSTWTAAIPQPDLADLKRAWVLPLYGAV